MAARGILDLRNVDDIVHEGSRFLSYRVAQLRTTSPRRSLHDIEAVRNRGVNKIPALRLILHGERLPQPLIFASRRLALQPFSPLVGFAGEDVQTGHILDDEVGPHISVLTVTVGGGLAHIDVVAAFHPSKRGKRGNYSI